MKKKYRIAENRTKFLETQKRIADLNEELKQTDNIENELHSINAECGNMIDVRTKKNVHQSINAALQKNVDVKNELTNKVEKEAHEIKNVEECVSNLLDNSKKQSESLHKKELLKRFDEVSKGVAEIDRNISELTSLKKTIENEEKYIGEILEKNNGEIDAFISIPDKEDTSWEIQELLKERKIRAEALEEVCSGTLEIFETSIEPKVNPIDYAQAKGGIITTAVNVITISSALLGEFISMKIKGEKE